MVVYFNVELEGEGACPLINPHDSRFYWIRRSRNNSRAGSFEHKLDDLIAGI